MKKNKLFILLLIGSILFLAGCSDDAWKEEGLKDSQPLDGRAVTLTAKMPGEKVNTPRVALVRENNQTILTWEEGDKLQLLFHQGDTKIKGVADISNISADKTQAEFTFTIPSGITSDEFDLYGVYGGGGLSGDGMLILPENAGEAGTLEAIQDREDVVLYFEEKDLTIDNISESLNVTFQHLGSLFNINLMNLAPGAIEDLKEVRLISSAADGWAYNSGTGGNLYDLVTKQFSASSEADGHLSFQAPGNSISSGGTLSFWAWYPPATVFPELKLELIKEDDSSIAVSVNTKAARSTELESGKNYTFHAIYEEGKLQFTDPTFNGISTVIVGGQFLRTGLMRYYPNFITPARLPDYEEWLDVYALVSLKDMKTYSMDYFVESAANTANIDLRLSVSTTDSRTILGNSGTFANQYDATDGTTIASLEGTDRLIVNQTRFKRITTAGFDFVNATEADVLTGGNPTLNYIQRPAIGQDGYTEYGNIFGFKTAPTSTVGERVGVMKEISRIQIPDIPGYGGINTNMYNLVVYAIKLY